MFIIKNDVDLLKAYGFLNNDFNRLFQELEKILNEQSEYWFEYIKNEQESIFGKISFKLNGNYFATMLEDVRHIGPLIPILSITDQVKLNWSKVANHERNLMKFLALEKKQRPGITKIYVAAHLLE